MNIKIAAIPTLHLANTLIPELSPAYPLKRYQEQLTNVKHLGIVAEIDGEIAGFKVGYALSDTHFYSWMGGVVPAFRRRGVAKALAIYQENWCKAQGFQKLSMKTRNNCRNMLLFAVQNDFLFTKVEHKGEMADYRIYLEKML